MKQESISMRRHNKSETLKRIDAKKVDYFTRRQFKVDFGNSLKPVWNTWKYFDKATFSKGRKTYTAFFGPDAKLVGTTCISSFSSIPADAQKYIKSKYKDYKVEGVIYYDDNEANSSDLLNSDPQFEDQDNYFVELHKRNKTIILQVDMEGYVYFFKQLS